MQEVGGGLGGRDPSDLSWWVRAFRAAGAGGLAGTPLAQTTPNDSAACEAFARGFRDELGNRRPADRAFLAALFGVRPVTEKTDSPEARLWRSLAPGSAGVDVFEVVARSPGPLLPDQHRGAIEVWTEAELAALHALDRIAMRERSQELAARVESAARWHLAEIQPDNATNRPWAIHVFARLGARGGEYEALLHAETMLHNCRVALGHADRFSACILEDAARALGAEVWA